MFEERSMMCKGWRACVHCARKRGVFKGSEGIFKERWYFQGIGAISIEFKGISKE